MTGGYVAAGALVLLGGLLGARFTRVRARHERALDRLEAAREDGPPIALGTPRRKVSVHWAWWVVGAALYLIVPQVVPAHWALSVALVTLALVLARLVADLMARFAITRFETQLAEALDMVVSALRAGLGTVEAFERAAHEAHAPLKAHLQEIVERLRLGESARDAVGGLAAERPLESVRLFAFALAAHMEGGGSLAPTLASVARATRDRVALDRRVLGQTSESQASVTGVLVVTYGLAAALGTAEDSRLATFLDTDLGSWVSASAVFLQCIGLVWMGRMARSGI